MDKGVRRDYLDRQFKAETDEAKYRRDNLSRHAKQRFYDSKAAYYLKRDQTVLSEFEMMQQSRPLKPRSQKR